MKPLFCSILISTIQAFELSLFLKSNGRPSSVAEPATTTRVQPNVFRQNVKRSNIKARKRWAPILISQCIVVNTRLQSYEKSRTEHIKLVYFLCRDGVTSLISRQSYEKSSARQRNLLLLLVIILLTMAIQMCSLKNRC